MLDAVVELYGIDTPHDPSHVAKQPRNMTGYLLMCFSTPFYTLTTNGYEDGQAGNCLIHSPKFPYIHGTIQGEKEGFRNDWIYVSGSSIPYWIEKYQLPLDEIIPTERVGLFSTVLHTIKWELLACAPHYMEKIALLVGELFLKVARQRELSLESAAFSPSEREYKEQFIGIRRQINANITRDWTVSEMSALANLGPNRFSVLYRKFFEISPKADLINMRLEQARIYLQSTNDTIENIAFNCGFNSSQHFSRLFKKKVGCSPNVLR